MKLIVEETFQNVYGKIQQKTLFRTYDWKEAEKFFLNYKTDNRLEIWNTINADCLAWKPEKQKDN